MLFLEDGAREGPHEEATPSQIANAQLLGSASDTKHKHFHAMISLLRPEDTVKLVRSRQHLAESASESRVDLFHEIYTMSEIPFNQCLSLK